MADEIDRASEMQQLILDNAIAAQLEKGKHKQPLPKECLNGCGELPLPGGSFCSASCSADFDYRREIRRRQGLA